MNRRDMACLMGLLMETNTLLLAQLVYTQGDPLVVDRLIDQATQLRTRVRAMMPGGGIEEIAGDVEPDGVN